MISRPLGDGKDEELGETWRVSTSAGMGPPSSGVAGVLLESDGAARNTGAQMSGPR